TTGCTPGSTLTFTITYPSAPGNAYWKYGPTPSNPAPQWYVLPATFAGNVVTFTITDGGVGDDDMLANGAIVDQGGPGIGAPSTAQVPTLGTWAMLLLSLMLLGTAYARSIRAR